jgi:hypothetical protein
MVNSYRVTCFFMKMHFTCLYNLRHYVCGHYNSALLSSPHKINCCHIPPLLAFYRWCKITYRKPNKIWDIMLQEKTARLMYAKNREKILQQVRDSNSRFFIVNFYKNGDVKITNSKNQDASAEFGFNVPHLLMRETLDIEFNKSLTNYLVLGRNLE